MMPRVTFAALAPLVLVSCASTGSQGSSGSGAQEWLEQAPPRAAYDSPLAVAQALVGNYPESLEGSPTMQLDMAPHETDAGALVMTIGIEPFLDDSVAGQQWRATLRQDGAQWRVVKLDTRQKCWRGDNAGQWSAQICP